MKSAVEEVKNNWVLIAFIGAMIIWYANVNTRLANVEAETKETKTALQQVLEMKTDIAVIKTDINYIKAKVK